jgi:amidase
LASFGPLARSIDDLQLALAIIAGPDHQDTRVPLVPLDPLPERSLKSLRIAWTDSLGGVPVDREVQAVLHAFVEKLEAAGCQVEQQSPPNFDIELAWQTWGEIVDMELGVYTPWLWRLVGHVIGASLRRDARMARSVIPITFKKYMKALTRRDKLIEALESFLSERDVWLCPVTSTAAFKHIQPASYMGPNPIYKEPFEVNGQRVNYWMATGSLTTVFNATGSPVVSMPMGSSKQGLPIGVQVIGRRWWDMELLAVAKQLAEVADAFQHPRGYNSNRQFDIPKDRFAK